MKRIGFHYFQDTEHYQQSDLDLWLPKFKTLGAGWIVLTAPHNRAIPENFIQGLVDSGIEPVLHFRFNPDQLPPRKDLHLLFRTYALWGVKYIAIFDRPNLRTQWKSSVWVQNNFVERFLDIYLPLAELCLQFGLTPIFPPLEPGGDYWDTTFLRGALQGMQRRKSSHLLEKLVVGATAFAGDKPLNWGAGGPERCPGVKPYFSSSNKQDHRGFRIFDWYDAIIRSVLIDSLPIFLFGMGCSLGDNSNRADYSQKIQTISQLLAGEEIGGFDRIPSDVIGGAFRLFAGSPENVSPSDGWYQSDGKNIPIIDVFQKRAKSSPNNPSQSKTPSISHYLLLPTYEGDAADFHLDVIRPFMKKFQPTVGYSIEEAKLAKRVTVVGGESIFPETLLNKLRGSGCIVDRISDGIDIASKLASIQFAETNS